MDLLFWAMAYKLSDLIFALHGLGAMELLREGATEAEIAAQVGISRKPLSIALDILRRARIVEVRGQHFHLTPTARAQLPILEIESRLRPWHERNDSLRRSLYDGPPRDPLDLIEGEEFFDAYVRALAGFARETALRVFKLCHPSAGQSVLDLGGADGAVGHALAELVPGLSVTSFDRVAMSRAAERHPPRAAVRFVSGDLRNPGEVAPLAESADFVLMLKVAHLLAAEPLLALLERLASSMRPGARLVVYDLFPGPGDALDTTHLMLLDWMACSSYFDSTAEDFAALVDRAGFRGAVVRRFPNGMGAFVLAEAT